jgi:outer membrane protein OmpA-like peptidoglycan-associated protein
LALFCALSALPASAQDALKELLGKAQSQAEQQAVEELIRKLQGQRAAPPVAAPAPPAAATAPAPVPPQTPPPVIEARPTPEAPPAPAKGEPEPEREVTKEVAKEASPASAPAAPSAAPSPPPDIAGKAVAAAAQRALEEADKNELPSVDLEVYFNLASTDITPQAAATLTPLGRALADPRLAEGVFLIAGHSDAQGPPGYNRRLSQRRAEAVRQFLISKFGINPERLLAQGFGEDRLKNPKNPSASENRRVQVVNMAKQAAR